MKTTLTKLEQTVLDQVDRGADCAVIATQLNRPVSAINNAYARAVDKKDAERIATRLAKPALPPTAVTDGQILEAIGILGEHHRGLQVLAGLRQLFLDRGANGLDTVNMKAMQTLVQAVASGRRDFLYTLPDRH